VPGRHIRCGTDTGFANEGLSRAGTPQAAGIRADRRKILKELMLEGLLILRDRRF